MNPIHARPLLLQAATALYRLAGETPNLSRSQNPGAGAPDNTTAQLDYNSRDVNLPLAGNITNNNSSVTLFGANPARRYLFIQNISLLDVWINFDVSPYAFAGAGAVTRSSGTIILPAGGSWEPESAPGNSGFAICGSSGTTGTCIIIVLEGIYGN